MKSSRRSAALVLLVLLAANPAYAGLESCRDPTPDERFQLDLCSAHAGCRLVVALMDGCASVTNGIRRFFSSQKPELDPGEYQSDRNAPLGPSEIEQARKDNELYQRNQSLRESAARDAYNGLVVSDRSIKARLERYCGNPLDQGCKDAVQDAESLANRLNAYNNNPDHVALRGKLTAESPGIAAPYGKLQAAAWEETNRKSEELNKSIRERQAAEQKLLEAEKKKKEGNQVDPPVDGMAAKLPGGVDAITDMLEKGVSKVSDWFSKAFSSEQKPSASEEEQKTAREAGAWVDQNLAATQARAEKEQEERNRKAQEASARLERAREAERIANQSPAERLTEGFDQRIATARQQCAANDSSCNSACMAVAAVGVLSIFMARGSASGAAGEQVQQCSNRCDQAKSSCEQEVSALEQEKSQAISAATRGPTVVASANTGTTATTGINAGSRSCREILESLVGPINDGNPTQAAGSNLRYPLGQIYSDTVWAAQIYVRVANTHPACANDQSSKDAVAASLRSTQAYCRQAEGLRSGGPFNCSTGQSYGGTAARTEAAIRQLFQQTSVAGGGGASARPPGGDCKTAVDQQEADFTVINQRGRSTGAAKSAVSSMQVGLYMTSERLKLLDRLCRGQPQYEQYASMRQSQDNTMRACKQIATNSADCAPRVAW